MPPKADYEVAKTETVSDAESSFSLSQGKSQGKNENLMPPTPPSSDEQPPAKPAEPDRPIITVSGKRVQ